MSSLFNLATATAAGGHRNRSGYKIDRSVRLRSTASAYFNRTPASAGNRKTWTWSAWVKRGAFATQDLFSAYQDGNNQTLIVFSSDTLIIYTINGGGSFDYGFQTTAVFRDPSAWYHIVCVFDSTNATAANRAIVYVNGVQQAGSMAYGDIPLNQDGIVNSTNAHAIGRRGDATNYFDGHMTEVNFIDGQALTPLSFGETNPFTGVWRPKKYTGTYGTNGFYLNFSDNSAATAAAIGKDSSGNGNNWTPNNISVSSGVTYDSMLDVPTPYIDGGNGRGNYATLNPLWGTDSAGNTYSYANLILDTNGSSSAGNARCTIALPSSGKFYCEMKPTNFVTSTSGTSRAYYGILATSSAKQIAIRTESAASAGLTSSAIFKDGVSQGAITTLSLNNILGFAIDCDAGTVQIFVNNVSVYSGSYSVTSEPYFFGFSGDSGTADRNSTTEFNFGQRPFVYTPPTGFKTLSTLNLPTPTILKGNQYFDTILWSGDGVNGRAITANVGTVDFAWVKKRNGIDDNRLANSVTGGNKHLKSNTTEAEQTGTTVIQAFGGNTFTVGSDNSVNASGGTYVGWTWQKGATQGFDIVTFTNTASSASFNHNLGVTPAMIILKGRGPTTANWTVFHTSLANMTTAYLNLNNTNAVGTLGTAVPAPTSTTFGSSSAAIPASESSIAYLFSEVAGFSKFGSYTGNGSTDGPFVFCGFRPRFILTKAASGATGSWWLYDTVRSTYNEMTDLLRPDLSNADTTQGFCDALSNGFKIRNSGNNTNSATYIFAAFAEHPFKNALAR